MTKSKAILIWGGGTGILSSLFFQVLYGTGQENSGFRAFNFLILFMGLLLGTMYFRKKVNGGYLTFGKGFQVGFLMCLIMAVIGTITLLIDLNIHPEIIDKIREQKHIDMINSGYTGQQIDISMPYVIRFTTPFWMVLIGLILNIFFGAIFSLITAAICTRKKPIFDDVTELPLNEPKN